MRRQSTAADGQRRATVTDVARRAGVSTATVSRVLNRNYPVAEATRERVESAMRELGYVVNAHARALAGVSNRTVGIIVNEVIDPFYAYIARGVEREAALGGRLCLVCCTQGDPQRELAFIDLMHERRADAVVVVGGSIADRGYTSELARRARELDAGGSKLVLCGRPPLGEAAPTASVEYDNEGGAFAITDHLLMQGHERILYLGGPPKLSTTRDRLAGHRRALELRGLLTDPELVQSGAFSRNFGYRRMTELIRDGLEFTAVFAANDVVAARRGTGTRRGRAAGAEGHLAGGLRRHPGRPGAAPPADHGPCAAGGDGAPGGAAGRLRGRRGRLAGADHGRAAARHPHRGTRFRRPPSLRPARG